ncbi:hypothetical protein AYI70_g4546 [Smittium culicis]|uniref:Uncharacterized protein n=1 Tax=Smittium culicis TaxID=133412 RepID=A0A1R1XYP4_9FUNG|nr:hypothetical protein AYI70_g4546 [Smittium culicis]
MSKVIQNATELSQKDIHLDTEFDSSLYPSLSESSSVVSSESSDASLTEDTIISCKTDVSALESDPTTQQANPTAEQKGFFNMLYEIPVINSTVSSIKSKIPENKYSDMLSSFATRLSAIAESRIPADGSIRRSLVVMDSQACKSLKSIEVKYPIISKPTDEVIEAIKNSVKEIEASHPTVAGVINNAKNSAISTAAYIGSKAKPEPTSDEVKESEAEETEETVSHSITQKTAALLSELTSSVTSYVSPVAISIDEKIHISKAKSTVDQKIKYYNDTIKSHTAAYHSSISKNIELISNTPTQVSSYVSDKLSVANDSLASLKSKISSLFDYEYKVIESSFYNSVDAFSKTELGSKISAKIIHDKPIYTEKILLALNATVNSSPSFLKPKLAYYSAYISSLIQPPHNSENVSN